jgi:hypothetical protein
MRHIHRQDMYLTRDLFVAVKHQAPRPFALSAVAQRIGLGLIEPELKTPEASASGAIQGTPCRNIVSMIRYRE